MIGSVETFNALEENPDLQIFSDATLNQLYFAFNQESEYLRDPKVREALSLVYDYNGHVEQARGGQAEVARGPLPSAIPFFDEAMQPSTMDIEAGESRAGRVGVPGGRLQPRDDLPGHFAGGDDRGPDHAGRRGRVEHPDRAGGDGVAGKGRYFLVARNSDADGHDLDFPRLPGPGAVLLPPARFGQHRQWRRELLALQHAGDGRPDRAGRPEMDEAARAELYKELQEWWVANRPYMDVVVGYALSAARTWLQGYQWSPTHSFTQNVYPMSLEGKGA